MLRLKLLSCLAFKAIPQAAPPDTSNRQGPLLHFRLLGRDLKSPASVSPPQPS